MGREKAARNPDAPRDLAVAKRSVSSVSASAVSKQWADETMDPHKCVKQWKKGRRKQAHEELQRILQTSPTPVAHTARTWLLYMEWDEQRTRSGEKDLARIEEMAASVRQAASQGVASAPASITCAEISLTTSMQLLETLSSDELSTPESRRKMEDLKLHVAMECTNYLNKEIDDWSDPSCEMFPGMQGLDSRMSDTLKQRLLAKLEKFRDYRMRVKPPIARTMPPVAGLEDYGIHMQQFSDSLIDRKIERLRLDAAAEARALAAREEGSKEARSNNPKLVQHYLHQHAAQADHQSEVSAHEARRRRGRGGRGRSGAVEEARLEQSRNKKEIKVKAAREERMKRSAETKQFCQKILPQDKDERLTSFISMLKLDIDVLRERIQKQRTKEMHARMRAHVAQLEEHGAWHLYSRLSLEQLRREECFHSVNLFHDFFKQQHLSSQGPDITELYAGKRVCHRFQCPADGALPTAQPDSLCPLLRGEGEAECTGSESLGNGGDIEKGLGLSGAVENGNHRADEGLALGPSRRPEEGTEPHGTEAGASRLGQALARKIGEIVGNPLTWYTNHLWEHLNIQDAAEDAHDVGDDMLPLFRRLPSQDFACHDQGAYWFPRTLPMQHLENLEAVGEQLLKLSRGIEVQKSLKAEQEATDLSPDKAVELQSKLQEIEQDIQFMILRLKGVGIPEVDGIEDSASANGTDDGAPKPLAWSVQDESSAQFRPEYMRAVSDVGMGSERETEAAARGGEVSEQLRGKQELISDICFACEVLEKDQLFSQQLAEALLAFLSCRPPFMGRRCDPRAMLAGIGHLHSKDLERLRGFLLQQLGLRGRVMQSFYETSQAEEEGQLGITVGFERDDLEPGVIRFTLSRYDFMRQKVLESKCHAAEGHSLDESDVGGACRENRECPNCHDLELEVETAILEDIYSGAVSEEAVQDDARESRNVHRYESELAKCNAALHELKMDIEACQACEGIIGEAEGRLLDLQPHIELLQENTGEAATKATRSVVEVVQMLKELDHRLAVELWKWNNARFKERIEYHSRQIKELEEQVKDTDKELTDMHSSQVADQPANGVGHALPAEMRAQFSQLSSERESLVQRLSHHQRSKGAASQQFSLFKQNYAQYSELSGLMSGAAEQREFEEAARTFEAIPDRTGALPGMIGTLRDDALEHLALLKLVNADMMIRAEALLVKARQCAINCLALGFHKPPEPLLVLIKDLACENLEQRMREHKAVEAEEYQKRLLMELEQENSLSCPTPEKDKKKKQKGKNRKVKRWPKERQAEGPRSPAGNDDVSDEPLGHEETLDESLESIEESCQEAASGAEGDDAPTVDASCDSAQEAPLAADADGGDHAGDRAREEEPSITAGVNIKTADQGSMELAAAGDLKKTNAKPPATLCVPRPRPQTSRDQKGVPDRGPPAGKSRARRGADEQPPQRGPAATARLPHDLAAQGVDLRGSARGQGGARRRSLECAPGANEKHSGLATSSRSHEASLHPRDSEAAAEAFRTGALKPAVLVPGQPAEDADRSRARRRGRGRRPPAAQQEVGARQAPAPEEPAAPALPPASEALARPATGAGSEQDSPLIGLSEALKAADHAPTGSEAPSTSRPAPGAQNAAPAVARHAQPQLAHGTVVTPLPGGVMGYPVQPMPAAVPYGVPYPVSMRPYLPYMPMPVHGMPSPVPIPLTPPPPAHGGHAFGHPYPMVPMPSAAGVPLGFAGQRFIGPVTSMAYAPAGPLHPPDAPGHPAGQSAAAASAAAVPGAARHSHSHSGESEVDGLMRMLKHMDGGQEDRAQQPHVEGAEAVAAADGAMATPPSPPEGEQEGAPAGARGPTPPSAPPQPSAEELHQQRLADQEQADLDAAIAASLQDTAAVREAMHSNSSSAGDLAMSMATQLPQLAREDSEVAAGVGLMNGIGEYNCFLNVIVQCLWHLTNFRQNMLGRDPEIHNTNDVVRALYNLFEAFSRVDDQRKSGDSSDGATPRGGGKHVVSPTELREALSAVEGQQIFRLGEMNDAGEVLGVLWSCMQDAHEKAFRKHGRGSKPWKSLALVDEMFGLEVHEVMVCSKCQKETRQATYVQYRQTVPATALRLQRAVEREAPLGRLIHAVIRSHALRCDPDEGGCSAENTMSLNLRRPPGVLTLELAWATERAPAEDIRETLAAVEDSVDLSQIYDGLGQEPQLYRLRSMVCYYGAHYQAFVLSPDLGKWLIFDDESISVIGDWPSVTAKCVAGRVQPSVLFFELADSP